MDDEDEIKDAKPEPDFVGFTFLNELRAYIYKNHDPSATSITIEPGLEFEHNLALGVLRIEIVSTECKITQMFESHELSHFNIKIDNPNSLDKAKQEIDAILNEDVEVYDRNHPLASGIHSQLKALCNHNNLAVSRYGKELRIAHQNKIFASVKIARKDNKGWLITIQNPTLYNSPFKFNIIVDHLFLYRASLALAELCPTLDEIQMPHGVAIL